MKLFAASVLLFIISTPAIAFDVRECLRVNKQNPIICYKLSKEVPSFTKHDKVCVVVKDQNVFTKQYYERIRCF